MNDTDSWFERGHVAIVTGASKGFGRAVARLLAERGIKLVITARGTLELHAAAREFEHFVEVEAIAGDVRDAEHIHALVRRARERFGRIDLVINNASSIGESPLSRLETLAPSVFEELFETNVYAPLHLAQHALPELRRTGGTIVNVTSDAATNAYPTWGGYGASKAALEHLSRTLAAELDGFGVSVLVVDPGNMNTDLHQAAEPGDDLSSLPKAREVAPAILRALAGPRETFLRVELQSERGVLA